MPKKKMTPEERKAFGEKMRKAREAKKQQEEINHPGPLQETERPETDLEQMRRQMDEIMETNALLKAALLQKQDVAQSSTPQVNQSGKLIGLFEKYVLDKDVYPSPVERLAAEPRLKPLAFDYNYHLEYDYTTRQYSTKQGIETIEPEFTVTLWRNVLDEDGKVTKRYRARRMVFHEDPQAAMTIARENNVQVDAEDERTFLNEMRYLRVRDWLFDIFWPRPKQESEAIREEVIGNQLVQVIAVNSEDSKDLTGALSQVDKFRS